MKLIVKLLHGTYVCTQVQKHNAIYCMSLLLESASELHRLNLFASNGHGEWNLTCRYLPLKAPGPSKLRRGRSKKHPGCLLLAK